MSKGERIRALRKAKNITQIEMAKLLNTTKQTVSKYEKGIVTNIPSDRLERMAMILDTTPEHILGWEEAIVTQPMDMAVRHAEMIADEDLNEIFDDFRTLGQRERQIVKDLVHSLAQTKTEA